jgi:hypothetical protein
VLKIGLENIMSSQTKIDLSGYWYDFYLKEIWVNPVSQYLSKEF